MTFAWILTADGEVKWKVVRIIGGVVLIAALVVSVVWGQGQSSKNRAHVRSLEAANVTDIKSLVTARDEALEIAPELRATIKQLEERVPDVRIVETVTAVTNPINVQLRDLVSRQRAALRQQDEEFDAEIQRAVADLAQDRPDCSGLIRPDDCPRPTLPDLEFKFHITSDEARLESNAGNTFATGFNVILEGDCLFYDDGRVSNLNDVDCSWVGGESWRADITRLTRAPVPSRPRIMGYYLGVQYGISLDEARATASCVYGSGSPDGCIPESVSLSVTRFRPNGGVEFRFKRLAIRTGVFVDTNAVGLDVGISVHRER